MLGAEQTSRTLQEPFSHLSIMEITRVLNGKRKQLPESDPLAPDATALPGSSRQSGLEIIRVVTVPPNKLHVKSDNAGAASTADEPPITEHLKDKKRLEEEIEGLKWLAKKKEEEWDKILNLLKYKEKSLLKLERKMALEQNNAKALFSSLNPAVASSVNGDQSVSIDSSQHSPGLTIVHCQSLSPAVNSSLKVGKVSCDYCLKEEAEFECADCCTKKYCSRHCQLSHWPAHSANCSSA